MDSYTPREPRADTETSMDEPKHAGWSDVFLNNLRSHLHGDNLTALAQPKPNVAEVAYNFAGSHMPADAFEVARVAHIAELAYHLHLSPNIGRALLDTFSDELRDVTHEEWRSDSELMPLKYTFGLMRDFPIIADFIKDHEVKCEAVGHEYVDIEGLVDLVEKVNFESIIIKSALDYSNFMLLDSKEYLTDKEKSKMRRVITAIKTVDSPLLALTGFDALEAEILSKAYCWELNQSGDSSFVAKAAEVFEGLGGRAKLAETTEEFLDDVFAHDTRDHGRVTSDQEQYSVFFGDGSVTFDEHGTEFRILTRLKSVGATAKKMHALYNKTETLATPTDIVGITLIAKDEAQMSQCLAGILDRLSDVDVTYTTTPSRSEQVHVKGSDAFLSRFGKCGQDSDLYNDAELSIINETCDNGYEAVKLTLSYLHNGIKVPIEIQITHETARRESRVGLGSHTLFKLVKLAKNSGDISISKFSKSDLLEKLKRISIRKRKFDKGSYETNGGSTIRANAVFKEISDRNRSIGGIAIK